MKSQNLIREVDEAGRKLKELMAFSNQFPERGSTMKRTIEELSGELERIRHSAEEIVSEKKRAAKDRKPKAENGKSFQTPEQEFKTLAENSPDLIARVDERLKFIYINPALSRAFGDESMSGKLLTEIKGPEKLKDEWVEILTQAFATGREEAREFKYRMENNFRFYDVCVVPEYFDHKIVSVLLIGRDITERKEAENALRASENRLRLIVENSPDGLFQQDRDLRYTWLPGQFFCGIAARNLLGKTDSDFFPRDEARRMTEMKQKVMETGVGIRTDIHMLVGGREKYFDVFYEPWRSHAGEITGIVGYVRDITERKCAEKALEVSEKKYMELSITDPLTSLFNLRHFYDSLRTEIERVNRYHFPLSILMLDIDNFKSVNDRYGHYEGDNVLKRMGDIMKRYIRQVDSAYRYGGEEFTLILPETESEEAIQVAERIRQGFKTENFSPKIDEKVHLTVSIGVARYFPKEELIAFLKRVDENLYRAKAQGKDRVYYHEKGGESSFLM